MIYLDWNAGAPLSAVAAEAMYNAAHDHKLYHEASVHSFGRKTKGIQYDILQRLNAYFKISGDWQSFKSGFRYAFSESGAQANRLVVRMAYCCAEQLGKKLVWCVARDSHADLLDFVNQLEALGVRIFWLEVDDQGTLQSIDSDALALQSDEVVLCSINWVNNETGRIQDVDLWARKVRALGYWLHIDAIQAFTKIPLPLELLRPDFIVFSSYKFRGPPHFAMWIVSPEWMLRYEKFIANKVFGWRSFPVLQIIGFLAAAQEASQQDYTYLKDLQNDFEHMLVQSIPHISINAQKALRVPSTTSITLHHRLFKKNELVMLLDRCGYAVSSGSACKSGIQEPSHVLVAMGRTLQEALASVRISYHAGIAWKDLKSFCNCLESVVKSATLNV